MNDINHISELKEKINRKKQAEALLAKTKELLQEEQKNLDQQKILVKKEYEDVLRLEGNSLSSVFYSFLGNKVEKLDKERQEYLSAKLKYEGNKDTINRLEEDIRKQEKLLLELGNPEEEYKSLIQDKKVTLVAQNDQEYLSISTKMENSYSMLIEIEEAVSAGEKAYHGINKTISYMSKAKGWGTFDVLGGGMIATAVKHSHIDQAKSEIQQVQYLLKRFVHELKDVKMNMDQEMVADFGGFNKVADFFFDNLIFDWVVQSRIHKTLDNLNAAKIKIGRTLAFLKKKSETIKKEYNTLKTDLANYIENS
ncbi:MAG: hypothetical protein JW833_08770 [Prolixibacteraceae bacterium]|nr:hypothetical protein [Prolixibacteraceae bacterium]